MPVGAPGFASSPYGGTWDYNLEILVGAPGFEPGTSCSQSKRASRTALRPEYSKTTTPFAFCRARQVPLKRGKSITDFSILVKNETQAICQPFY